MKSKSFLVFGLLLISSLCHADIMLHPGDSIFVSTPERVSCDGGNLFAVQICDCKPSSISSTMGQAVGAASDIANQCQNMSMAYHPFNCQSVTLVTGQQVICDCMPSSISSSMGQAMGTGNDIQTQCQNMSMAYHPFNCRAQ